MVILKENEIQLNPNGATMKANKQEIEKWKNNIDEYFDSLNYTKTIKEVNNNLISQHMYICSQRQLKDCNNVLINLQHVVISGNYK